MNKVAAGVGPPGGRDHGDLGGGSTSKSSSPQKRREDELFPLLPLRLEDLVGLCQKDGRDARRFLHDVNECIRSLNWMSGYDRPSDGGRSLSRKSLELQNSVRQFIVEHVLVYDGGEREDPKEAFAKLLRGRGLTDPRRPTRPWRPSKTVP